MAEYRGKNNRYTTGSTKYHRPKKYMFFSGGTGYTFNPDRNISYDGKLMNILTFHKEEVKARNRKDVFLLDEYGNEVPKDLL